MGIKLVITYYGKRLMASGNTEIGLGDPRMVKTLSETNMVLGFLVIFLASMI